MQAAYEANLKRKQVMLSDSNIEKIKRIAKDKSISEANVVRLAISSFNPDGLNENLEDVELFNIVSSRLKETIEYTASTREKINETIIDYEEKRL